jgi:SAM-dependent methyltransferase
MLRYWALSRKKNTYNQSKVMKYIDRFLQRERIKKVAPYVESNFKILDIGCNQGELFQFFLQKGISVSGVGIEPTLKIFKRPNIGYLKMFFLVSDYKSVILTSLHCLRCLNISQWKQCQHLQQRLLVD